MTDNRPGASHLWGGGSSPALGSPGFTEAELRGILGGKFLRLFRRVWGA